MPLLPTPKVTCTVPPTGTDPALTEALVAARCSTPVTALPLTGTITEPWLVETRSAEEYEPAIPGLKSTDAVTDCWGSSTVPTWGRPDTAYGPSGRSIPVTRLGLVPRVAQADGQGLASSAGLHRAEGKWLRRQRESRSRPVARDRDRLHSCAGWDRQGGDHRPGAVGSEGDRKGHGRSRCEIRPSHRLPDGEDRAINRLSHGWRWDLGTCCGATGNGRGAAGHNGRWCGRPGALRGRRTADALVAADSRLTRNRQTLRCRGDDGGLMARAHWYRTEIDRRRLERRVRCLRRMQGGAHRECRRRFVRSTPLGRRTWRRSRLEHSTAVGAHHASGWRRKPSVCRLAPSRPVVSTAQTTALPDVVPLLVTKGEPDVYPNDWALVPAEASCGMP